MIDMLVNKNKNNAVNSNIEDSRAVKGDDGE